MELRRLARNLQRRAKEIEDEEGLNSVSGALHVIAQEIIDMTGGDEAGY